MDGQAVGHKARLRGRERRRLGAREWLAVLVVLDRLEHDLVRSVVVGRARLGLVATRRRRRTRHEVRREGLVAKGEAVVLLKVERRRAGRRRRVQREARLAQGWTGRGSGRRVDALVEGLEGLDGCRTRGPRLRVCRWCEEASRPLRRPERLLRRIRGRHAEQSATGGEVDWGVHVRVSARLLSCIDRARLRVPRYEPCRETCEARFDRRREWGRAE